MRGRHSVTLVAAIAALVVCLHPVVRATHTQPDAQATGSKVWIGHAKDIEEFLRTARAVRSEDVSTGVTRPKRVYLEPGGPVESFAFSNVFGRFKGYWDSYMADIAAYEVDKLLGLNMVPPVVEREFENMKGRASFWVPDVSMYDLKAPPTPPDSVAWVTQIRYMKMFDNLIGNADRNQGNMLIDPQFNLILIDHTRAFTTGNRLVHRTEHFSRSLWERTQALTQDQLQATIGKYVSKGQIKDMLKRRTLMDAEIQRLVKASSEAAVFVK